MSADYEALLRWLWWIMTGSGWLWLIMTGYFLFVFVDHVWLWLVMVDDRWLWLIVVDELCFIMAGYFLFSLIRFDCGWLWLIIVDCRWLWLMLVSWWWGWFWSNNPVMIKGNWEAISRVTEGWNSNKPTTFTIIRVTTQRSGDLQKSDLEKWGKKSFHEMRKVEECSAEMNILEKNLHDT